MGCFLITNFHHAPDLSQEAEWLRAVHEIGRDFPSILDGHDVYFSGVGLGWRGVRRRGRLASRARFRAMGPRVVNALLGWSGHFADALALSGGGGVTILAPTAEAAFGAALAKAVGKRIALVVRAQGYLASKALRVKGSRSQYAILEAIERFVMRHTDLGVAMGRFTYDLAIAQGLVPANAMILPFPVQWRNQAEVVDLPTEPCVSFAGRLEREKGVGALLKAIAIVLQAVPNARLKIAGEGPERAALEASARGLGIEDRVSFLGWLGGSDLLRLYRESMVVVLPSIWEEGLGMVLVEAGLMGRPVIASDLGGIRDIVAHGQNGLLVSPGDSIALAHAILEVFGNRERARVMGYVGTELAARYLDGRDEALKMVERAIHGLLSAGPGL